MTSGPADVDVAVLGAGPAGLMAALTLARCGRSVVVLEQAAAPGGMAASFSVAGVRVDHGSHRLHRSCAPEVLAVLTDLLGADLQRRPRHGRIRLQGRWIGFPPRPLDVLRHLPPGFGARVARDAVLAPARRARRDTFAEVVRASLGPALADGFYRPYVQKIWGVPPEELSGELARRRVGARSGADLLRRLRRPDPDAGTFRYPKRGFGEIVERLAEAAVDAGADLRTRTRVTGVTPDGTVGCQTEGSDPGTVRARHAFSTLPLPLLARLADAPPDALGAADALEHRALALVYIVLPVRTFTAFDAHYLPEPDFLASRVSEPRNYRDAPDLDPPDRTVLCAEVPCSVGDDLWRAPADALAARVLDDLARAGLPSPRPIHAEVRHVPHAYPVYRVGFEAAHEVLDRWVLGLDRVVSFGRQGLFAHDNTHHALLTGLRAAEALDASTFDRARWERDRSEFRTHVVED